MNDNKKCLIIIDSNALMHRAYHALPRLTTKKGELVNAIYGFLLIFLKIIKEFQPDYIAATFDTAAPTFRHKKFKEYKIKRIKLPDEFYCQIPKIKEILKAFDISIFEKQGFEADDIIGTISASTSPKIICHKIENIILSGDLDVLQLINKNTKACLLRKGIKNTLIYDKKAVEERYGFQPSQLNDFKALKGDQSDNISGVPGIGEKTAIKLIQDFNNLENLYEFLEKEKINPVKNIISNKAKEKIHNSQFLISDSLKTKLLEYKEQAFFSRMLVTIRKNVPLNFNLENCQWKKYNKNKVVKLLKRLEFYTLINRLPLPIKYQAKMST